MAGRTIAIGDIHGCSADRFSERSMTTIPATRNTVRDITALAASLAASRAASQPASQAAALAAALAATSTVRTEPLASRVLPGHDATSSTSVASPNGRAT